MFFFILKKILILFPGPPDEVLPSFISTQELLRDWWIEDNDVFNIRAGYDRNNSNWASTGAVPRSSCNSSRVGSPDTAAKASTTCATRSAAASTTNIGKLAAPDSFIYLAYLTCRCVLFGVVLRNIRCLHYLLHHDEIK